MRKHIKEKIFYIIFPLLVGISYFTYLQYQQENKSQQLFVLHSGVQTCFTRIGQSFSAFMMGQQTGAYLRPDFLRQTEECIGEALRVGLNLELTSDALARQLNSLSTDTHHLHQKFTQVEVDNQLHHPRPYEVAQNSFKSLEALKEDVLMALEQNSDELKKSTERAAVIALILGASLFVICIGLGLILWKQRKLGLALEGLSHQELSLGGRASRNWEALVAEFLDLLGLTQTKELFVRQQNMPALVHAQGPVQAQAFTDLTSSLEEKTAMNSAQTESADQVQMVPVLEKVVDLLAQTLFSQGIYLNLNVQEGIRANGQQETLLEIVYNLTSGMVELMPKNNQRKVLTLGLKKKGEQVLVEASAELDENHAHTLTAAPMQGTEALKKFGAKMQICSELLQDLGAPLEIERIADKNIVTLRPIFVSANKTKSLPRLASLKRGKKRDFMLRETPLL